MNNELQKYFQKIQDQMDNYNEQISFDQNSIEYSNKLNETVNEVVKEIENDSQERLKNEFFGFGPLEALIADESITEILVNSDKNIYFEKNGRIHSHNDHFYSPLSYRNCLQRLLDKIGYTVSLEKPFCDFKYKDFRVSIVDDCISHDSTIITLRRHSNEKWSLERLFNLGWCNSSELSLLKKIVKLQKNFLVIGSTGEGKTTVVNALLADTDLHERSLIIEDTQEIQLPNPLSIRLLTRDEAANGLCAVDQGQLVKRALRLRPDRLVMGEIRGNEAKDFILALSTGHRGSFGTLHARDPQQALLRLEMLIQMGAPHWKLSAIRRLLSLSLDLIIATKKDSSGQRKLDGIYRINSLEENGFLVERLSFDHIPSDFL